VEMWLTDAGLHGTPEYLRRYDRWLGWFDEQQIEAVGFGWLSLRRAGRERPVRRLEEWPYEIEQPVGPAVSQWAAGVDALPVGDVELLGARLRVAEGLVQETVGEPGAADPERILLRLQRGVRRARQVDTVEAGFVGACDGELQAGQLLDALAELTGAEAAALRSAYLPRVLELLVDGILHLSDRAASHSVRTSPDRYRIVT